MSRDTESVTPSRGSAAIGLAAEGGGASVAPSVAPSAVTSAASAAPVAPSAQNAPNTPIAPGASASDSPGAVPAMSPDAAVRLLGFLRRAERLKDTTRSAWTTGGRHESTAEHSWRLCLLAMLVRPEYPHLDFGRVLRMCVVHDLGEALNGDIAAVDQAPGHAKADAERRDLLTLLGDLSGPARDDMVALWDEYDAAATPEARLVKGLDKLETLVQHTQGANPKDFDYRFNLGYGRAQTDADPLLAALRALVDMDTARLARERQGGDGNDAQ